MQTSLAELNRKAIYLAMVHDQPWVSASQLLAYALLRLGIICPYGPNFLASDLGLGCPESAVVTLPR